MTAGELLVTTGRVAMCSPEAICAPESEHVRTGTAAPPGRHPVILALTQEDRRLIVIACLRWSMEAVESWEPGPGPAYVEHAEVDAFLDCSAFAADEQTVWNEILSGLDATIQGNPDGARASWTDFLVDPSTGLNLIVYRSGTERGCGGCYLGRDAGGAGVCLTAVYPTHAF